MKAARFLELLEAYKKEDPERFETLDIAVELTANPQHSYFEGANHSDVKMVYHGFDWDASRILIVPEFDVDLTDAAYDKRHEESRKRREAWQRERQQKRNQEESERKK